MPIDEPLSTRNVSKLTTYELRQELTRRGKLDVPEESINHRSMLQRLIQVLLEDEQRAIDERTAEAEAQQQARLAEAKADRDKRKQEALERSRQRQLSGAYFEQLKQSNAPPEKQDLSGLEELSSTTIADDDGSVSDPFSEISGGKTRSKVHVR